MKVRLQPAMLFFGKLVSAWKGGGGQTSATQSQRVSLQSTDGSHSAIDAKGIFVVGLGQNTYFVHDTPLHKVNLDSGSSLRPATVIVAPKTLEIDENFLASTIADFLIKDDVFEERFLQYVVFVPPALDDAKEQTSDSYSEPSIRVSTGAYTKLKSVGTINMYLLSATGISQGPYFISQQGLFQPWKLYPDTNHAFLLSTTPDPNFPDRYNTLTASSPDAGNALTIAVPSRLHYTPSSEKPLSGMRVAIKDNIFLNGVKTSGASKAHYELYPPADSSAPAAARLIELGAIIVGKTALSQFADAEDPTADYVDYHCPFNPRGDRYRTPGGSSSGAGAAIAAYDWLDFTIGTDSKTATLYDGKVSDLVAGGSVRGPASYQGVFGIRPSRGAMSVEKTLIIDRDLDAIGVLARDLDLLEQVIRVYYSTVASSDPSHGSQIEAGSSALKLLYPTDRFPVELPEAQAIFDKATSHFEETFGISRQEINLHESWPEFSAGFTNETFEEYFKSVLYNFVTWGQLQQRRQFREQHVAQFSTEPLVNPLTRLRWTEGANLTENDYVIAREKKKKFQDFVQPILDNHTYMLTPFRFGEPETRDIYRPEPSKRDRAEFAMGWRPAFHSVFSGQPEIVFPIGTTKTTSALTKEEVNYPVMASLIGPPGHEATLIRIVKEFLRKAQIPTRVETGRDVYRNGL